jgi:hypothetical protein
MEQAHDDNKNWITLKAATDSALAKQQINGDREANECERTCEAEQREAERAKVPVG